MIRSSVRSAGLAVLLAMNGCGGIGSSDTGAGKPGLNVAEAALRGGSGQIALQVSEGVLRGSPNNARALEIKADALALLGAYDQATEIYQSLLAKDPGSNRAAIGLGRVALSKQPAAAEALFQQVLKRDPREMTALNNLGIARDLQGHHAEAQTVYRQALAINPDLESAQANLALSMAMTGQGAAAVKLLKPKASQPGVSAQIKHDYAVVLAMAGNRAEAERVLAQDLAPEDARRVLDNVTGTHTKTAGDAATERSRVATSRDWNDVPPDVVQVPEVTGPAQPAARTAQIEAPRDATLRTARAIVTAMASPPPTIVRPQATSDVDSASFAQPVNPVAAAVANQHPLAQEIQGGPPDGPSGHAFAVQSTADQAVIVPAVVAMPPAISTTRLVRPVVPVRDAVVAPPPAPALHPAPLPPSYPSGAPAARNDAPARQPVAAPTALANDAAAVARVEGGHADVVRFATPPVTLTAAVATVAYAAPVAAPADTSGDNATATHGGDERLTTRSTSADATAVTVQFAATASEESAHSFWDVLMRRFPDMLAHREPVVVRFEHAGNVFWRVRAEGFADLSDAQTVCARVRADGQACFVPRS